MDTEYNQNAWFEQTFQKNECYFDTLIPWATPHENNKVSILKAFGACWGNFGQGTWLKTHDSLLFPYPTENTALRLGTRFEEVLVPGTRFEEVLGPGDAF